MNKVSETCESISKGLICISLVSQKKRKNILVQNKYLNNGRNFPKFSERHIFKDSRTSVNPENNKPKTDHIKDISNQTTENQN